MYFLRLQILKRLKIENTAKRTLKPSVIILEQMTLIYVIYRPTDYNKPSRTPSTLLIETNTQSPSTRFISSAQTALNYRQRYATTTAIDTSVSNTSYQRSADYQRPSHRISLLPPNYAMRPRPNNNFDSMSIASLPPPHLSESGSHTGSASTPSSINASPFSQSVISHPNFNYSQQQRISTTQSIQQPVLSFQQQPVAKKMRFHQSNDDVEVIPLKIDIKVNKNLVSSRQAR